MSMTAAPPARAGKMDFLSFQLGGLEYGVELRKVKELRTLKSLERFAADGAIIQGVAVSHGVIMPIVDMRVAVDGAAHPSSGPLTDVIILQLDECVMGMVVDGVTDVVGVYPDQITPIPGTEPEQCGYLLGLGEAHGKRLILIDIDRLMSIRREAVPKVA